MAVARSYQNFEIITDPYVVNGRNYVDVKNPASGYTQRVRWYTDAEYTRMYGEKPAKRVVLSPKEKYGFIDGYITIFKGNTYPHKEWLKEQGAKFTKLFNWAFASNVEWDEEDLPVDLEPIQIPWEAVSQDDKLLPDTEIKEYIDSLMYEPSNSVFVGEVGERIEETLTVTKAITLNGYYGTSTMHIMEDADGNVFVWTTAAKTIPEGRTVVLRGTVKDHKTYKGTNQTILTRCKEL